MRTTIERHMASPVLSLLGLMGVDFTVNNVSEGAVFTTLDLFFESDKSNTFHFDNAFNVRVASSPINWDTAIHNHPGFLSNNQRLYFQANPNVYVTKIMFLNTGNQHIYDNIFIEVTNMIVIPISLLLNPSCNNLISIARSHISGGLVSIQPTEINLPNMHTQKSTRRMRRPKKQVKREVPKEKDVVEFCRPGKLSGERLNWASKAGLVEGKRYVVKSVFDKKYITLEGCKTYPYSINHFKIIKDE